MLSEHVNKSNFSTYTKTETKEIEDYIYLTDNFRIKDGNFMFDLETNEKVKELKTKYKKITYRLRYDIDSYFFNDVDLCKNLNNNKSLLDYNIYNVDLKSKILYQRVPLNTKIKSENGYINIEDSILKLNYNNYVKTTFDLSDDPNDELTKYNGKVVNYISNTNTVVFNDDLEYINIRDAIIEEKIKYFNSFTVRLNGIEKEINNVLVYREKFIIGTIEKCTKITQSAFGKPLININGVDFEISYGINKILKKYESVTYYELLKKFIGEISYEEYDIGNTVYFKDKNILGIISNNGITELNTDNIVYSYDMPSINKNEYKLWFNMSNSSIFLYNKESWIQLSKPNIYTIGKIINIDRKLNKGKKISLELYGYNEEEEFKLVDMFITKNVVTDVEFYLSEYFIESVYINGEEIYDYHEANWGIHLGKPLFKNDHIQIILSKNKKYEWVTGFVIDSNTLGVSSPFEVEQIKMLVINENPAFVNKIDQNRVKNTDISFLDNSPNFISECDRIYAKVLISKNICNAYPTFVIDYKDNCREIELPFDVSEFRFDKLMITNKGKEVIINPQIIINMDDLYASYDPNSPKKLKFNRLLRYDDHVIVQFINHKICPHNPENMFGQVNSKKDLDDMLIMDSIVDNSPEDVSMPLIYEELDNLINSESNIPGSGSGNDNDNLPSVDSSLTESMPSISTQEKSDEEKIMDLVDEATLNSDPDVSKKVIYNNNVPYTGDDNDKILARPSSTVVRPVVHTYIEDDRYSEYNLEFTRQYMKMRDEMKNYLLDINDKLVDTIYDITRVRDSLEAMIDYVCNILCIEEILTAVIKMFNGILKSIQSLINMDFDQMVEKMKNLVENIGKALQNAIGDVLGLVGGLFGESSDAINDLIKSVTNLANQAMKIVGKVADVIGGIMGKVGALFNMFDITTIGLKIGNFFSKMIDAIAKAIMKVFDVIAGAITGFFSLFTNFSDTLQSIIDKLDYFTSNIKDLTNGLTLAGIKDLICNKILGSILNMIDGILDILKYLQERYLDFLNKLFADRFLSKKDLWDDLWACGSFLKSHIDLCQVLRELISEGDLTLTGFIKKVTNITEIFDTWKHNKEVLKEIVHQKRVDDSEIDNLAGAISYLDASIRSVDELFSNNSQTIDRIINRLKDAFVPSFKKEAESVADIQAMSDQLFDPNEFKELWRKVVKL